MKILIKLTALLLLLTTNAQVSIAGDIWDGKTIASGFYGGSGTKNDPYTIYTASQFAYFYTQMANAGRTFSGQYIKIMNDIDMLDENLPTTLKDNSTIVTTFSGDLDGGDHTIIIKSGYTIDTEAEQYFLIRELYGSIHDIVFDNHKTHGLGYDEWGVATTRIAIIMEGGEMYNCRFKAPMPGQILINGGVIANCIADYASYHASIKTKMGTGFCSVPYQFVNKGACYNCDFDNCHFQNYNGWSVFNYGSGYNSAYGSTYIDQECNGKLTADEHNEWVATNSTSTKTYKTWPLTFSPTYPAYNVRITYVDNSGLTNYPSQTVTAANTYNLPIPSGFESEFLGWECNGEIVTKITPTDNVVCTAKWKHLITKQPNFINTEVVSTDMQMAKCQWKVGAAKTIFFEDPQNITTIDVPVDNMVLFFDYIVDDYKVGTGYSSYNSPGYISIDGVNVVYVEAWSAMKEGTLRYVFEKAGVHTISKSEIGALISNMSLSYPTHYLDEAETLPPIVDVEGETSNILPYSYLLSKSGVYFCDIIYKDQTIHSDGIDTYSVFEKDGCIYSPISETTVALLKVDTDAKTCLIPQAITHEGTSYDVTAISDYAFAECTKLESIICMVSQPIALSSNAFASVPSSLIIYVQAGKVNAYNAAPVWKNYIIRAKDSYPAKLYNGNSVATDVTVDLPNVPTGATASNYLCFINEIIRQTSAESSIIPNIVFKVENGDWVAKEIELSDAKPFYSPSDITAESISYTRTFSNTNWQSLYIPYNLSYDDWSDKACIAELAGVHTYEDAPTIIEFITVKSGDLLPNTPYVIRALSASSEPVTFTSTNKNLSASPDEETRFISCSSPRWTYKLFGNYQPLPVERVEALQAKVLGGGKLIYSSTAVKPMRFYLVKERSTNGYWGVPALSPDQEEILIMIDGVLLSTEETNAILSTFADGEDGAIYNIQGIKVNGNQKGIIIKNGKKVFQK